VLPQRPAEPPPSDLTTKLREDWQTIKKSFTRGPDELRRAIDRLGRQLGFGEGE
jgi:hypothetical protein